MDNDPVHSAEYVDCGGYGYHQPLCNTRRVVFWRATRREDVTCDACLDALKARDAAVNEAGLRPDGSVPRQTHSSSLSGTYCHECPGNHSGKLIGMEKE